ncbi:MAG: hypothetical protein E7634_01375 [Ruminococcaceae bacterium]|nr:hypothetical protein [Oscillospiraceae bacterium]
MPNIKDILIYNGDFNLKVMLWSLFIGISIAIVISYVVKIKFGAFIRFILDKKANSPETAISLDEFNYSGKLFIKFRLKDHNNYKNMLVAVTEEGKYYTNCRYFDTAPAFKQYVFKTKKSMYEDPQDNEQSQCAQSSETSETAEKSAPVSEYDPGYKQRVNFNVETAKFYIPDELHDRAASIYFGKPTNLIAVLACIIAFGVLISFADNLTEMLVDFMQEFIDKLNQNDNIV